MNGREAEVLKMLGELGAVIKDSHVVYASGKHGSAYINKDAVYPYPPIVAELCGDIVMHFMRDTIGVTYEVVVGPEKGGIILAQWTAYNSAYRYERGKTILAVYAEKEGESFVFHRGYDKLITGKRILVVEDVLTTGGSVKKVVDAVRALGGEIVGVGALCNCGGVTAEDIGGVPELYALVNVTLDMWDEADCPLCNQGVPINTDVGKGREYIVRKNAG